MPADGLTLLGDQTICRHSGESSSTIPYEANKFIGWWFKMYIEL